jgi:hypothetical protein
MRTFPGAVFGAQRHFVRESTGEMGVATESEKIGLEKCAKKGPFSRGFLSATPGNFFSGKPEIQKPRVFQAQMVLVSKWAWKNWKGGVGFARLPKPPCLPTGIP